MCFDFFPDLSNESVNFAFVWLISGVVPEFSESIFALISSRMFSGRRRPAWVPARVFRIKITEKKGFVAVIENCVQFNSINGAVWRSVNTRHRDFSVVSYM
ncbi:hypothetical protein TNCV_4336281 [Trichonephila clavipes]|nr:hypothetical protein TNCV_4336281 [Trichonephila clavipes]